MTEAIERIVVALDAASELRTTIETAARLAARWRVPLHGLFVEDEELICLAGLPFASQVTLAAGREPLRKIMSRITYARSPKERGVSSAQLQGGTVWNGRSK